jgi:hypothetical protein
MRPPAARWIACRRDFVLAGTATRRRLADSASAATAPSIRRKQDARVAKLADAPDLGSGSARSVGSSPSPSTPPVGRPRPPRTPNFSGPRSGQEKPLPPANFFPVSRTGFFLSPETPVSTLTPLAATITGTLWISCEKPSDPFQSHLGSATRPAEPRCRAHGVRLCPPRDRNHRYFLKVNIFPVKSAPSSSAVPVFCDVFVTSAVVPTGAFPMARRFPPPVIPRA